MIGPRSRLLPCVAFAALGAACSGTEAAPLEPASAAPQTGGHATACPAPAHPFLAPSGTSNLHGDTYMSDTYAWAGPASPDLDVVQATLGGECASLTFDAEGRILTVCIAIAGDRHLLLLDPTTLTVLARYDGLPTGSSATTFGAGGYFYLDERSRVVVATADDRILRLAANPGTGSFDVVETLDLTTGPGALVAADGTIESALPDWAGRVWYVTEAGAVGFVDPASKQPRTLRLAGEAIGNSFAVDETGGVFVVTDHALYRLDVDASGAPTVTWREAYDRGSRLKPGQVNFGSGTTPTLFGDGWVAVTDNADPRMNVLVYARGKEHAGARKLCEVPVFGDRLGGTENSLIGCNRSLVVENNYGYASPASVLGTATTTPGFTRIDVRADASGCDAVWTSSESAPSVVSKLSVASDAVYSWTRTADGWFLTTIEFASGQTRWSARIGDGFGLDNYYAPISLGADGAAYVGVIGGLVAMRSR